MAKKPSFPNRPCPKCQKPIHIKSKKHEACGWSADGSAIKAASRNGDASGETIAGYFRKIFSENPGLLKKRSNATLLERWLADHPGEKAVPENVKTGLAYTKSVLRSKKRRRKKAKAEVAAGGGIPVAVPRKPKTSSLETLEEHIDDCLTFARQTDMDGLETVIRALRSARNSVVWKMGQ